VKKRICLGTLTKVEGHAKLNVEMDGKAVKKAELEVFEPSRYFEEMVVGKRYDDVTSISQRICGICSVVHTVTSIKAIENAIGVRPSAQTEDLRRLLLYASNIHSHTAHLFFFAAPDYVGCNDITEMARKRREDVELAIELQRTSSGIVKTLGGRPIHPVSPRVGFFSSVPDRKGISSITAEFERLAKLAEKAARIFMSFKYPGFDNRTEHLGLTKKGRYPLYNGDVSALGKTSFRPADYMKHLEEEAVHRSTAKYARFHGGPYMVGALPRLNLNRGNLSDSAKRVLRESGIRLPSFNAFLNNFAQALEMVDSAEKAVDILGKYAGRGMREERPRIRPRPGRGVGICEAPRGTLIHDYEFGSGGRVTHANIMTPTCQNVRNMEHDMQKLMPPLVRRPDREIKKRLEMLIRAYDPCFSCSTHFLELRLRRK
jgi:sulfhydrogenase subunit alpha